MNPTIESTNLAISIISKLFNAGFRDVIIGGDYLNHWFNEHEKLCNINHLRIVSGCTKICIISSELENWVIKIGYDSSGNSFVGEAYLDYCEKEAENYHKAEKEHIERFFAAIYKIYRCDDIDIYLQEKVNVDDIGFGDRFYDYCAKGCNEAEFKSEDEYNDHIDWLVQDLTDEERVLAILGEDELSKRVAYFVDYNDINDLHEGNWGITKDSRVVLIDYSGY